MYFKPFFINTKFIISFNVNILLYIHVTIENTYKYMTYLNNIIIIL